MFCDYHVPSLSPDSLDGLPDYPDRADTRTPPRSDKTRYMSTKLFYCSTKYLKKKILKYVSRSVILPLYTGRGSLVYQNNWYMYVVLHPVRGRRRVSTINSRRGRRGGGDPCRPLSLRSTMFASYFDRHGNYIRHKNAKLKIIIANCK